MYSYSHSQSSEHQIRQQSDPVEGECGDRGM
jgi:hypothetical protein